MRARRWAGLTAVLLLAACGTNAPAQQARAQVQPQRLKAEIVEVLWHDPRAFTQGFELAGGTLYEGTGRHGKSQLRKGEPGKPPGQVHRLDQELFGEGITVTGTTVWQLTWKAGTAFEYDRATLRPLREARYSGEGWGLCHQAEQARLVMSDGSAQLTFRNPDTFAELGTVTVTDRGQPVSKLNELECAGGSVYANVWQSDKLVRIDPATGAVTARIDASGLLTPAEREEADVLNGIAAIPHTSEFLLTGKLWPKTFRVTFTPAA